MEPVQQVLSALGFFYPCFQKITKKKYLEFIETHLLFFRLELHVKVNCVIEKYV